MTCDQNGMQPRFSGCHGVALVTQAHAVPVLALLGICFAICIDGSVLIARFSKEFWGADETLDETPSIFLAMGRLPGSQSNPLARKTLQQYGTSQVSHRNTSQRPETMAVRHPPSNSGHR
ncbi:hypothetical protein EDB86DRAFT_2825609 [Lactarius hatsudake]|nr:hypothetical protein EDB86DRAFT_2825609 [Lactarius hatsudake]